MSKSNNYKSVEGIDLRAVLKGFLKNKWWFIGTFVIILLIGLLVTFLRGPGYDSNSEIKFINKKDSYLHSIQEYFPEEISRLRTRNSDKLSSELRSEEVLEEVARNLSFEIEKSGLLKVISITKSQNGDILIVDVNYISPESAYEINKKLLDVYKTRKKSELSNAYEALIQNVEDRLADTKEEIIELSSKVQEYSINFNLELLKDIIGESSNIDLEMITYIPPDLNIRLDYLSTTYNDLEKIRYVLSENKEFFTNEIEIIKEPQIQDNQSNNKYIRGILTSLFTAIIGGLIIIFITVYFSSFRKKI